MTEDRINLRNFHKFKLARWWCDFNCFIWPDDYPIQKPDDWETIPRYTPFKQNFRAQHNIIGEHMCNIMKVEKMDKRTVLKYWNGPHSKIRNSRR